MVTNMARAPKGGDTDQIKAVASGECQIALTNTYYLARMMRSTNPDDRAVVEKVGVVFPEPVELGHAREYRRGRHREEFTEPRRRRSSFSNTSPATRRKAISPTATTNGRWSPARRPPTRRWMRWAPFKAETIPVSVTGMNQTKVQQMLDRVGYK